MKLLPFLILTIIPGCNAPGPDQNSSPPTAETDSIIQPTTIIRQGKEEFRKRSEISETPAAFPGCNYNKVVFYELNERSDGGRAEAAFLERTGRYHELSTAEVESFLNLINQEESYGNSTAACHDPKVGLVFYDSEQTPCAYLSLCLQCNNMYTAPPLLLENTNRGFSLATRESLRTMFSDWGFPDTEASILFDSEDRIRSFLLDQGLDSLSVEEEIQQIMGSRQ